MNRGVWVTGMGVVTAAGRGVNALFEAMLAGRSGLTPVEGMATTRGKVLGGQVKDPEFAGPLHLSKMATAAVEEALDAAALPVELRANMGLYLGTVASEGRIVEDRYEEFRRCEAPDEELREGLLRYSNGALADVLAGHFGVTGPRDVNTNACASGNIALARALVALRLGRIERALIVGADQLRPLMYWGSERAGLMGHDLRPFHKDRDGTVFGDGAAALILESAGSAQRRGAKPLATLAGWGLVCDDNPQLILPQLDGGAVVRCYHAALADAGLAPADIDYINPHGTGTVNIDRIEVLACKRVFGARAPQVPISSTKSLTGHLSAASPLVEAIACILSIRNGYIHPTAKLDAPDPELGLDFVPLQGRYARVGCAVSNSMGGGGTNAAVVLVEPQRSLPPLPKPAALSEIVISGAGVVSTAGLGREALVGSLLEGYRAPVDGHLPGFDVNEFVDAKLGYSYLSRAAQLALASALLAARDARLSGSDAPPDRIAVVFGTAFGGTPSWSEMLCAAYAESPQRITPNMALEHGHHLGVTLIARHIAARGANCTLTGGRGAGLEALGFAADLLRTGVCDVALVGGSDSLDDGLLRALGLLGCSQRDARDGSPLFARSSGCLPAEGAGCLVLERRDSAARRGARLLGSLAGFSSDSVCVPLGTYDASGRAQAKALRSALLESGLPGNAPALVCGSSNGSPGLAAGELAALRDVADLAPSARLLSLQGCLGETFAAGPILALIAGLGCLSAQRVPHWQDAQTPVEHDQLATPGSAWQGDTLVATCASPGGAATAAVFRREGGAA